MLALQVVNAVSKSEPGVNFSRLRTLTLYTDHLLDLCDDLD